MTAYEVISIILAVDALIVSNGMLLIALLTFLDTRKRKKRKK